MLSEKPKPLIEELDKKRYKALKGIMGSSLVTATSLFVLLGGAAYGSMSIAVIGTIGMVGSIISHRFFAKLSEDLQDEIIYYNSRTDEKTQAPDCDF